MTQQKRAASKGRLSELHARFADALIAELEQAQEEGIPLPAADKSVIAKFLKDNDITADADDTAMRKLNDEFQDDLAERRKARAEAIAGKIGAEDDNDLASLGII